MLVGPLIGSLLAIGACGDRSSSPAQDTSPTAHNPVPNEPAPAVVDTTGDRSASNAAPAASTAPTAAQWNGPATTGEDDDQARRKKKMAAGLANVLDSYERGDVVQELPRDQDKRSDKLPTLEVHQPHGDFERLSRADIEKVIAHRKGAIRVCYERELARQPKLAGTVVVHFRVTAKGVVTKARINEKRTTLASKGVGACIVRQISTLKFPAKGESELTVNYPFKFSAD